MKSYFKYLLLLFFMPMAVRSQPDTISEFTLQQFTRNLLSVNDSFNPISNEAVKLPEGKNYTLLANQLTPVDGCLFANELPLTGKFYDLLVNFSEADQKRWVQRFSNYESYFDSLLNEAGLPVELKYLAPALSGLNPLAVGADKRAGIWQLTHFQGILGGLEINRLVDERFEMAKATQVFIAQIKRNIQLFGSVEYAVLAYLSGDTKFRNAWAKTGEGASLNDLLQELPDLVSENVAAFQACRVFLKSTKTTLPVLHEKADTIIVRQKMHLQQVSQVLNIPLKTLQELNPQFRYSIVPGDKNEALLLPEGRKEDYIVGQDSIFNAFDSTLFDVVAQKVEYPPAPTRQYIGEKVKDLEIEGKVKIKYTLQRGDVLGYIAEDYNVQVEDLKYWNNIYNERKIQAGQQLVIFVDENEADYYRSLQKLPAAGAGQGAVAASVQKTWEIPASAHKVEHVVKSGESPYVIAKKYEGVTPEAILYWNGIDDARKIQIGQKLKIYVTE
ncbi:LysM peptidoglycan-binding domain-containing protein [Maribellus sp. YY47]|uniref:LysM peptidoglycan-binding domain-containing protein n=1 Tax=Maribellus sp. YY47 TaxID=2929486 RepID=UPI0020014819|nr:LysM peptidoglycan-binding domain-containing protein [Maribellus sp. YY47]MCK3684303.1 LysM peptidoglycan-binding domain-containing protein [Maribellus sp. YY47]